MSPPPARIGCGGAKATTDPSGKPMLKLPVNAFRTAVFSPDAALPR